MPGKLNSPMQPGKGMGKEWAGSHNRLALPVDHASLRQGATPNAAGINVRTGEVKPGSPGGSSRVNSPMTTIVPGPSKRKVK